MEDYDRLSEAPPLKVEPPKAGTVIRTLNGEVYWTGIPLQVGTIPPRRNLETIPQSPDVVDTMFVDAMMRATAEQGVAFSTPPEDMWNALFSPDNETPWEPNPVVIMSLDAALGTPEDLEELDDFWHSVNELRLAYLHRRHGDFETLEALRRILERPR